MHIRKSSSNNEYIRAGGVMVRNFTKTNVVPVDVSNLFTIEDQEIVINNEEHNKKYSDISREKFSFPKVLIVSDGWGFEERQSIIENLQKDIVIFAVNGALKSWKLIYSDHPRSINAYIINNPYPEAMKYIPKNNRAYFPACLASSRTSKDFCKLYKGDIYIYYPTPLKVFGYRKMSEYYIDDYRNPICAAIDFAYHFGVEKLMLFCCDDVFEEPRETAVQLTNGFWCYPQQIKAHDIIDAKLYWLTHQQEKKVEVVDFSSGGEYVNAQYITEKEISEFFDTKDTVK